jgi:hypothetical protein
MKIQMRLARLLRTLVSVSILYCSPAYSQSLPDQTDGGKEKKISTALYLGSCFANKHTAAFYDGYGYDEMGAKNNFINALDLRKSSFMYQKIVLEYGGLNGQTDQIAMALGVNPGEWSFNETDMPLKMKYNPALEVGLQLNYAVTKKNLLLLNINTSQLTASGVFSMVITSPPIGNQQPGYQNIQTFAITGKEQRLVFQAGYRRILGDDAVFNFFIEGGPLLNITKYLGNEISINNLRIDLSSYYNQSYYPTYRAKYLRGIGLGVFAGSGLTITANQNWKIQLLYSPSYEKIAVGPEPTFTFQHRIGVRVVRMI